MANQPESSSFDAGVYQLETTDPVQGGVGGVSNAPLLNLANRTRWLYNQITSILTTIAGLATLNSPALTGSPTAPTRPAGDSGTGLANTLFVNNSRYAVANVNVTGSSNVVLTAAQYGCGVINISGSVTANINVIFPNNGKWIVRNQTLGVGNVNCKTAAGNGVLATQGRIISLWCDGANLWRVDNDWASIDLEGVPTTSTPTAADNSLQIANTKWVVEQNYATQTWTSSNFDPIGSANSAQAAAQTYSDNVYNSSVSTSENYTNGKIAGLPQPRIAQQQLTAVSGTLSPTVSFTPAVNGVMIALGSRVNSASDTTGANQAAIWINGTMETGDTNLLGTAHMYAFPVTAGSATTAQYVATAGVQFTARILLIFIPYPN